MSKDRLTPDEFQEWAISEVMEACHRGDERSARRFLTAIREHIRGDLEDRITALEARMEGRGGEEGEPVTLDWLRRVGLHPEDQPTPTPEGSGLPTYRESCEAVGVKAYNGDVCSRIHNHLRAHAEREINDLRVGVFVSRAEADRLADACGRWSEDYTKLEADRDRLQRELDAAQEELAERREHGTTTEEWEDTLSVRHPTPAAEGSGLPTFHEVCKTAGVHPTTASSWHRVYVHFRDAAAQEVDRVRRLYEDALYTGLDAVTDRDRLQREVDHWKQYDKEFPATPASGRVTAGMVEDAYSFRSTYEGVADRLNAALASAPPAEGENDAD